MSFILDALRKSETDRQQQASAEFATIPTAAEQPGTPKWIWALSALLLVNAAILAVFLLRDAPVATTAQAPAPRAVADKEPARAGTDTGFRERLETARAERPDPPPRTSASTAPRPAATQTPATSQAPAPAAAPATVEISSLTLPTLTEIRVNDGVELPDLHLDIHVYGATSAERFVFINMQKLTEGDMLDSGPALESITPDGVILDYRGTRFVLPRE